MKKIRIGLFGLDYSSSNLGCSALAYSFLDILETILKEINCIAEIEFFFSKNANVNYLPTLSYENMKLKIFSFDKNHIFKLLKEIRKNELYFDFTAGDSFSDIYGVERFFKRAFNKTCVILARKSLILGPQTYGPFKNKISKMWAGFIIDHSTVSYARDSMSVKRVADISKKQVIQTIDVAFGLTHSLNMYECIISDPDKIQIGINISGLLFCGGYTRNNQFGLSTNYVDYSDKILSYLVSDSKYEIHLIPHATAKDLEFPDNDLIPIEYFKSKYEGLKIAPVFSTPIEAKSYISKMDIFIGARMHATIAAFSSNVFCIPFSYSPKFEGLYGSIGYNKCIDGVDWNTDKAIATTINYIQNYTKIKNEQEVAYEFAFDLLDEFKQDLTKQLSVFV